MKKNNEEAISWSIKNIYFFINCQDKRDIKEICKLLLKWNILSDFIDKIGAEFQKLQEILKKPRNMHL